MQLSVRENVFMIILHGSLLVLVISILDMLCQHLADGNFSRNIQSNPVLWPKAIIFGALRWPNQWFYQQRVLIWLGVDTLGYNISKNQLSRSKTVASSLKKVHFWNPIWRTPSALWNGPCPISLSFLESWLFWTFLLTFHYFGSSWYHNNNWGGALLVPWFCVNVICMYTVQKDNTLSCHFDQIQARLCLNLQS